MYGTLCSGNPTDQGEMWRQGWLGCAVAWFGQCLPTHCVPKKIHSLEPGPSAKWTKCEQTASRKIIPLQILDSVCVQCPPKPFQPAQLGPTQLTCLLMVLGMRIMLEHIFSHCLKGLGEGRYPWCHDQVLWEYLLVSATASNITQQQSPSLFPKQERSHSPIQNHRAGCLHQWETEKQLRFLNLIVSTTPHPTWSWCRHNLDKWSWLRWRWPMKSGWRRHGRGTEPCGWLWEEGVESPLRAPGGGMKGLYRPVSSSGPGNPGNLQVAKKKSPQ